MNPVRKQLLEQTIKQETTQGKLVAADHHRLRFHLMPKVGWMNDPNGLCQYQGVYHIFYQYSPLDAEGGMKAWGHTTTLDFIHYEQQPVTLFPDMPYDRDGVYSGSAIVADGKLNLFYTGNVKEEGDFDYTTAGRQANTVLVQSRDGVLFTAKELVMTNADYPDVYSCHIRDPKVWKDGEHYYMVQGARRREDKGAIILFASDDLRSWHYVKELTTKDTLGYMWECPDYFEVDGTKILSFSPQGVKAEGYRYQNIFQSGYYLMEKNPTMDDTDMVVGKNQQFIEWDMGYDFYAPQTFEDELGRRILIGWAGIPAEDYNNAPTVAQGWQHALTMPREITVQDGKVRTNPIAELTELRDMEIRVITGEVRTLDERTFELVMEWDSLAGEELQHNETDYKGMDRWLIMELSCQNEHAALHYDQQAGVLTFSLSEATGCGRGNRSIRVDRLEKLQIFVDTSMIEIYINDGEMVFTSRFYFADEDRSIQVGDCDRARLWTLLPMEGI